MTRKFNSLPFFGIVKDDKTDITHFYQDFICEINYL